jgi:hypothetical protein
MAGERNRARIAEWTTKIIGGDTCPLREKAKRVLGWEARPAARTVLECANSLLDWKIS